MTPEQIKEEILICDSFPSHDNVPFRRLLSSIARLDDDILLESVLLVIENERPSAQILAGRILDEFHPVCKNELGDGMGGGYKMSRKIKNGELEYNDHIEFINGDKSHAEIVGTNSSYIFYLEKENNSVQIAPISGTIKSIENK